MLRTANKKNDKPTKNGPGHFLNDGDPVESVDNSANFAYLYTRKELEIMEENLKNALGRWASLEGKPERTATDQTAYSLGETAVDRLLFGDPARGQDILWLLLTRYGSALRPYSAFRNEDANQRVIVQFAFLDWAKRMQAAGKPFARGEFPLFCLSVAPDDPELMSGFELKATGEHNGYAHTSNRSLNAHCYGGDCLGYGYTPLPPGCKENLHRALKALASQEEMYPALVAVGVNTHLIIGSDGRSTKALALRRANDWQPELTNLVTPPSPPREGPARRELRPLPETVTVFVGELGQVTHSPLWRNTDPSLSRTADSWRKSRMATFTANGGEAELLTIIGAENYVIK